mmetsp:Transcript_3056/g.7650  ORF Transcript_3056/g.7650 Transcript_3056/m.7650 type:complete len:241 (-) Transcript_3056:342-1064(-)
MDCSQVSTTFSPHSWRQYLAQCGVAGSRRPCTGCTGLHGWCRLTLSPLWSTAAGMQTLQSKQAEHRQCWGQQPHPTAQLMAVQRAAMQAQEEHQQMPCPRRSTWASCWGCCQRKCTLRWQLLPTCLSLAHQHRPRSTRAAPRGCGHTTHTTTRGPRAARHSRSASHSSRVQPSSLQASAPPWQWSQWPYRSTTVQPSWQCCSRCTCCTRSNQTPCASWRALCARLHCMHLQRPRAAKKRQ